MPFGRRKSKSVDSVEYTGQADIKDMGLTIQNIKSILSGSRDMVFSEIKVSGIKVSVVYVDGLVDSTAVSDYILKPLKQEDEFREAKTEKKIIELIQEGEVYFADQKTRTNINDVVYDILSSRAALIFDGEKTAITFDAKGFDKRSITEPTTENVIKGSKDSFVETLRVNTATVRRKIKSHKLRIKETIIGKQSLTSVAIIYIDDLTNKHLVDEVKKRLDKIDIDAVTSPGFIEENLLENKYSAFPQLFTTERTDKFVSGIAEGRVGLIIDGLPVTYVIPADINTFLQAPEDYSQYFIISSLLRFLRYLLMVTTILLPSFYVAVVSFHQEMIPTNLALSIEMSKKGVPFPSFAEVLLMLIAFETLVEAGLRLPKTIGQAVSIVGALVVGEAAVNAKLISPAVVVIIAITAISGFTMPNQDFSNALRLWRFILVIMSSIIGLFGLSVGSILLLYHLCKLEVFGVPYLSPYVANDSMQLQDTIFRLPYFLHKKRPRYLRTTNKKRQD